MPQDDVESGATDLAFGYCPIRFTLSTSRFSVWPLQNLKQTVEEVNRDSQVDSNWIYAPLEKRSDILTGQIKTNPYKARVFGLPDTHIIQHAEGDERRLRFLLWCLGFFVGMRTSDTEAGYLDAAPIKPQQLTDFICDPNELERALLYADCFYAGLNPSSRQAERLLAVLHLNYLAQRPNQLDFEGFMYSYIALDTCWKVAKEKGLVGNVQKHSKRVKALCDVLRIPKPTWIDQIASPRNDAFHEGLLEDEPLGYQLLDRLASSEGVDVTLAARNLICRAVVALLGIPAQRYIESSVEDRQKYGLDLQPDS